MPDLLAYINWNATPEIVKLGSFALRWYGLLFAAGFFIGLLIVTRMFKAEKAPEQWLDKVFVAMIAGAVVGARLGHVFFYEWGYYSQHPGEIIKVWEGGLASHGGAIGIIIALWIFSRFTAKRSILWILDKVVVPTALAGCFIRLGNLFNSEILGKQADVAWAFVFKQLPPEQQFPRHPVQIYESLSYLLSFFILYRVYWHTDKKDKPGYIFGLFMVLIWGFRFIWEYFKESQGGFETALGAGLTTGQWLSIPFVLIGLFFMFRPVSTQKQGGRPSK